jgi:hypothetical protein
MNHKVTHHLEGALAAADVGKNLMREFQISGDNNYYCASELAGGETDQNAHVGASTLNFKLNVCTAHRQKAVLRGAPEPG